MPQYRLCLTALLLPITLFAGSASAVELRLDDGDGLFNCPGACTAGNPIWFDVYITDPMGQSAEGIQITLTVVGPGNLTFDGNASENVDGDVSYWVFGNSVGATALNLGSDTYQFGDGPNNPSSALLQTGDIAARFAFLWDGVVGNYTVTASASTTDTFVLVNFVSSAPNWQSNPVTLTVPEPLPIGLLGAGAVACAAFRRRRRIRGA